MDDNGQQQHHAPTRDNILRALRHLVTVSRPGDAVFFHYSGHGGLLSPDYNRWKQSQQHLPVSPSSSPSSSLSATARATLTTAAASSTTQKWYDQTLIPVDHTRAGHIRDFSLFHHFVQPMAAGVTVTCLMDCCHSGSVLDLPYSFLPTHTGRGGGGGGVGGSSMYGMQENMSVMNNLAFLYLLGGGILPSGIFDNVTDNLQETLGGDLGEYQGMLDGTLAEDTGEVAADVGDAIGAGAGTMDTLEASDGVDMGDGAYEYPNAGDADIGNVDGVVVSGEEVTQQFGDGYDGYDGGFTTDYSVSGGDEGCGDEGCGDLFAAFADCLNDA